MAFNKMGPTRDCKKSTETSADNGHNANNFKQRNKGMGIYIVYSCAE